MSQNKLYKAFLHMQESYRLLSSLTVINDLTWLQMWSCNINTCKQGINYGTWNRFMNSVLLGKMIQFTLLVRDLVVALHLYLIKNSSLGFKWNCPENEVHPYCKQEYLEHTEVL
jgi:hypothetical protein